MRVIAQTEKCIASGTCALTCPHVFDQRDEDGVVHVVNAHPPLALRERILQAVDLCPAQVFSVENEDETGELIIEEDPSAL